MRHRSIAEETTLRRGSLLPDRALLLGGRTIASPALHEKADANAGRFDSGPFDAAARRRVRVGRASVMRLLRARRRAPAPARYPKKNCSLCLAGVLPLGAQRAEREPQPARSARFSPSVSLPVDVQVVDRDVAVELLATHAARFSNVARPRRPPVRQVAVAVVLAALGRRSRASARGRSTTPMAAEVHGGAALREKNGGCRMPAGKTISFIGGS